MSGVVVLLLRILLVIILYGFLAWALFTIWRDVREQGQRLSAPFIPHLCLELLDGESDLQHEFDGPEVIIGRSANSEFMVADETVSARHTRLSFHHNQWWVEDLQSTNGTYLNDERVNVPTVVVSGDELRCGQVSLLIKVGEKAA